MSLRSNYNMFYFELILSTVPVALIVYTCIKGMLKPESKIIPLVIGLIVTLLFYMLFNLVNWITYGRIIQLTEEGCTVKFLGFTKLYRWNQIKTKRREQITIGHSRDKGPTYNGLLFSYRQERVNRLLKVPTLHPFSLIFIQFEPCLNQHRLQTNLGAGYFADEDMLFSLLSHWGVYLDN